MDTRADFRVMFCILRYTIQGLYLRQDMFELTARMQSFQGLVSFRLEQPCQIFMERQFELQLILPSLYRQLMSGTFQEQGLRPFA